MADPLARTPDLQRHSLRGRGAAVAALSGALGLELPQTACRAIRAGERAALWLGPDEWLLLAPPGDAWAEALGAVAEPHALVDISHRQIGVSVCGPHAETILAIGCPLDLDPSAFPVGMCTRTLVGKAEVVLWRTAPDRFHLEVWRSFAAYLEALLAAAASELVAQPRLSS